MTYDGDSFTRKSTTDTSERGLEDLICTAMTGVASLAGAPAHRAVPGWAKRL